MRLTFLVPGRLDTLTGGYGYDRRMIEGLRARGWSVDVHELSSSFPFPSQRALRHASDVLAALPPDAAVMIDGLACGAMPAEVEGHATRLRIIALVHHPLAAEAGLPGDAAGSLYASERRALASARAVVVTSRLTATALDAYAVPQDRIAVVEPGTDRAPLARGSDGTIVQLLCVASIIPRKGYATLLSALASMPQRNWRLTCVGGLDRDVATVSQIRSIVRSERLDEYVHFVGEKDGAALAAEYDKADLFVLATEYEGYGMVVAEALARGLPVVSTPTGGIATLVGQDAGILVAPGDIGALSTALSSVVADSTLRARLAAGARRAREALPGWDDAALRMSAVIERVQR
jgi:glycosyltransferase involved in cell wall biosynthesis